MKKLLSIFIVFVLAIIATVSFVACNPDTENPNGNGANDEGNSVPDNTPYTNITLTINDDIVVNGYLNDSAPALSLRAQLPLTVRLNDSDNDFCGGNIDVEYSSSDVQNGYKNGDLAFWTPANNFVIFVDDEESSANTGNIVVLGRITDDLSVFDSINGSINVVVALAEQTPDVPEEPETPVVPENPDPEQPGTEEPETPEPDEQGEYQMRIIVGDTVLIAQMYDNSTAAAIQNMLPMELNMLDLYGREMCYRFADSLPTDNAQTTGYEVGEIVYYPPMHSFVIMYKQNGERFQMQKLGKIIGDVSIFDGIGNISVRFELV